MNEKIVSLSEICQIVDCPHSSPKWMTEGIPVIRNFNLVDGTIDDSNLSYVTVEEYKNRTKRIVPKENDILFSREAPIGNVAIIPKNFKCCQGQRIVLLRPETVKVIPQYLLLALSSNFVKQQINAVSNTGSIVSNFNIKDLQNLLVPLPSINNQQLIVNAISGITSKIAVNKKLINSLESLAKTIYDYWFLQFEFPNEDGKPYKSSGGKMVWNEELKREIPEGWEVKFLSTICKLGNGVNYEKGIEGNHFYRIINVRNISASTLLLNKEEMDLISLPSNLADRYLVQKNDILIARSGSPGSVRLIMDNEDVIYCGFIIHCLPFDENMRYYLTFSLKKYEGTSATKTGGSILQNVSQDTLKALRFPIPPKNVLKQFSKQIVQLINLMQLSNKENQELVSLRDFLLPMLMNGQVTFKD